MPRSAAQCAAIILAAGASRRLGRPKQLAPVGGEPLIRRTARLALEAGCAPVVVVLGAEEQACREALGDFESPPVAALQSAEPSLARAASVRCIVNTEWRAGMSTSLVAGLGAVAGCPAALVLACDQFRLTTASLRALITAHTTNQAPATAALYEGRPGVPAIFDRSLWPELAALTGDRGARGLLARWTGRVTLVGLPEAAFDLDLPEQLPSLAEEP